jgi:uncharacterized Zn finger protein (UPF0148 family)
MTNQRPTVHVRFGCPECGCVLDLKPGWLDCTHCEYMAEVKTLGLISLTEQANRQREESV